ncbi:hypothetical protein M422DRAFT_242023 [Sphaerobolus stellatus SS14]|nr:hypothetical protein M422DRAFT_242023 [Sphaerobolus stellatus SS14]
MAPKKKTIDKVPAGTGGAAAHSSTSNVIGGNEPTLDPGKDPKPDGVSHLRDKYNSSYDTKHPENSSVCTFELSCTCQYSEPSERLASADPDPKELALGDQIQEMLNTINEHMDEVKSIHNMSHQVAQLLVETNESNSALEARTRTWRTQLIAIREKYPTIAKGKSSIHPRDPTKDPNNEDSTDGSNNRSDPKQALGNAQTELLAKAAILERLYADQAPADHLNQAAMAA